MSDSEGSSSDFELVSHDSVKVAAPPSSGTVAQSASHSVSAGVGRPGFSATSRLATQDIVGRPTSSGSPATESTRRSLNTQLTHSQHAHAQSPPVTDSEYDALSESSMDEADHGLSRDAAGLERAMRVIASVKPSDSAVQDGRFSAFLSGHLSSSSVSETSSSCDLRASHSSLSHSTVSTTTSNDTDDDADAGANAQTPLVTSPLANALNGPAAANHGMAAMNQGDPFPSTFPMSVAHLPTFTLTHANSGGRQDEAPAAHHHQEQFTLPGADTDTDTDDERPLMDMDQVSKSNNAVGHHGFNCDLVMRSRLVHHGFVSRPTSDSFGPEDFEELGSIPTQGAQAQESEPDAHLDSVIDVTPQRSQMGTLANASAAELPDMFDVHRVSDTSALAVAAGETHLRDTASTAADPNGLMQLLPDFETDATRLTQRRPGQVNPTTRHARPCHASPRPPRHARLRLTCRLPARPPRPRTQHLPRRTRRCTSFLAVRRALAPHATCAQAGPDGRCSTRPARAST
ncbi:hypothetical protein BCR44DRAFT_1254696 [Catenaria anguillulae PL171]|uniref:Uncharacterized protein n=1 Tax=Catenaria anguillulae PL171 TaxID=765915 RepID=A0A1Y2HEG4_9FUNG|nr:hypothetical protein BCR44DRAFT_1254696 [Catenaria anguillulae PL171]